MKFLLAHPVGRIKTRLDGLQDMLQLSDTGDFVVTYDVTEYGGFMLYDKESVLVSLCDESVRARVGKSLNLRVVQAITEI